jgi:hypothetical protein
VNIEAARLAAIENALRVRPQMAAGSFGVAPTYKVFRADGSRVLYWRARRIERDARGCERVRDLGVWERRATWTAAVGWVRA